MISICISSALNYMVQNFSIDEPIIKY